MHSPAFLVLQCGYMPISLSSVLIFCPREVFFRMLSVRACKTLIPVLAIAGALTVVPAFATRTHRSATSGHTKTAKKKNASHQVHGQRQIDSDRAREIQTALIREHYMPGPPSGQWDAESQAAMTKYQADQGWQTKLTPDSRALIKLGLGPSQDSGKLPVTNQTPVPSTAVTVPAQQSVSRASALTGAQPISQ
jgi:hypothetical protein